MLSAQPADVAEVPTDSASAPPLAGRGVLVTRPREQSARLSELIVAAGGSPFVFPAIEIVDPMDTSALSELIGRLHQFDIAIFVSPTAVERGMRLVRARREFPAGLEVAAIGQGSARALRRHGVADVIAPEGVADSENLLALPGLAAVRGRSVVIFRGVGGRELLGDALTRRGARVEYAQCYRRVPPRADPKPLLRAWERGELHAVTATSSEALRNLFDVVGASGRDRLIDTPLFVTHERIAAAARELGCTTVIVAEPGDEGLVRAMVRHFSPA
jgi:uroporphyrinogen-III synthase